MTDPTTTPGTIVVAGTGRIAVEPDVADLRLGVSVARPTVDAARADAAAAMTAILAAIKGAGVAPRDIRTTLVSVQPRYDYRDGKAPVLTGYELANTVEVTIRDLATLGGVIDGGVGFRTLPRISTSPGRRTFRASVSGELAGRGGGSAPAAPRGRTARAVARNVSRRTFTGFLPGWGPGPG